MLQCALATSRRILGDHHLSTMTIVTSLSHVYRKQGDTLGAVALQAASDKANAIFCAVALQAASDKANAIPCAVALQAASDKANAIVAGWRLFGGK